MIDKNDTKTLNNFILKIKKLKLKQKIKQIVKTTKIKKKFIKNLIKLYFKQFIFFLNIIDFVFVFVNVL